MSGSEEKTLAPSQRKLRKAREKGQIPMQRDMRLLVVTAAGLLFLWAAATRIAAYFATLAALALDRIAEPEAAFAPVLSYALAEGGRLMAMLFLALLAALVVSSIVLNRGVIFTTHPLTPKLSNMDPVKGLGRMFGARGMSELGKSLVRMILSLAAVALVFWLTVGSLVHLPATGVAGVAEAALWLGAIVLGAILFVAAVAAVLDLPLQAWLFQRDQKMTRTEQKLENKDMHGAPEIRKALRRLRNEAARLPGKVGLPKATLVIFGDGAAVALRYVRAEHTVPIVVARGQGDRADALLDAARPLGVPHYRDAALAARLVVGTGPGNPIQPSEYGDVARAIGMTGGA